MPEIKKNTIVVFDNRIAKVRNVSDNDLIKLKNEENDYLEKEKEKQFKHNEFLKGLENDIKKLKLRNFHLAKSIYDNFVDRGLIKDDKQFQKDYYEMVFKGKELELKDTPADFQTIYRKVVD